MQYQIHKSTTIEQHGRPIVLVSRTETFVGTITELEEHLLMFDYAHDNVVRDELKKQLPKVETEQPDNDEVPF